MTDERGTLTEQRADTGFLLIPLAVLVITGAGLLATVLGLTFLVPPGCGLANILSVGCTVVFGRMSNFFTLLIVPGTLMFAWQAVLRRRRTRPFDRTVFPAAAEIIDSVLATAALAKPVNVRLGPRLGRRAYAGGTQAKPYLALGPEVLTLPAKGAAGRDVFEAVLRHELAHVQNKDLLRYQSATALRLSTRFAAAATLLLLVIELFLADRPPTVLDSLGVLVRCLILAGLAELVVRAFFRAREHQADLRAAGGDPALVQAALHGGVERHQRAVDRLLSWHPTVAYRRAGVADATGVLRFPLGQVAVGGLFVGAGLGCVQGFIGLLQLVRVLEPVRRDQVDWPPVLILAAFVALPAAVYLAVGTWRDTWGALLSGRRARPWAIGLVFGAGLVVGSHLVPYSVLLHEHDPSIAITAGVVAILGGGAVAVCAWLAALIRYAFQHTPAPGARPPRGLLPVAAPVVAGFILLVWLAAPVAAFDAERCAYVDCDAFETDRQTIQTALGIFGDHWPVVLLALAIVTTLALALRQPTSLTAAALTAAAPTGTPRTATAQTATPPTGTAQTGTAPTATAHTGVTAGIVRAGVVRAAAVTGVGVVVELLLMYLPIGDAFALDWTLLDSNLEGGPNAIVFQATFLVAVVIAALAPVPVAGPLAAAGALLVGLVGFVARVIELSQTTNLLFLEFGWSFLGTFLGTGQVVALLLIVCCLGVRRSVSARSSPHRP